MYIKLREETQQAGTPAGHDAFYESYVRFADLVNEAVLGGRSRNQSNCGPANARFGS